MKNIADYYRNFYGDDTDRLFTALKTPPDKIAFVNPWLSRSMLADIFAQSELVEILSTPFYRLPKECSPRMINGLLSHYFLDLSSVFAPLLLPIEPNMHVLDMCSAPGGKLLIMLSRGITNVQFIANDMSKARFMRLNKVIAEFVPQSLRQDITLSMKDAHHFGLKQPHSFDAILLDAPCSSEGHVMHNETLLKIFKGPQKGLPMRQYSLLAAALLALRPHGHVMYATCSINPLENEKVIEKLLKKKSDLCSLVELTCPLGKSGPFGVTILPHIDNAGPAFLALLKREI